MQSPTTYICNAKFQGNLASSFSEIDILGTDSKSIAENRLFSRLKYKTPNAHLHMAISLII